MIGSTSRAPVKWDCHRGDVPSLSPPLPSRSAWQARELPRHPLARAAVIRGPLPPGPPLPPAAVQPGSLLHCLTEAPRRLQGAPGGLAGAMAFALGLSSSGACPGPTCSSSAGSSLLAGWQGASLRAACLAPWRCTRTAPRRRRQQVRRQRSSAGAAIAFLHPACESGFNVQSPCSTALECSDECCRPRLCTCSRCVRRCWIRRPSTPPSCGWSTCRGRGSRGLQRGAATH